MNQTSYFCKQCNQMRLFRQETMNHTLHLLASVFLCGLWLPFWILLAMGDDQPWHCQFCGMTDATRYLANPNLRQTEKDDARYKSQAKAALWADREGNTWQEYVVFFLSDNKVPLIAGGVIAGILGVMVIMFAIAGANSMQPTVATPAANVKSVRQIEIEARRKAADDIKQGLSKTLPMVEVVLIGSDEDILWITGKTMNASFASAYQNKNAEMLQSLKHFGFKHVRLSNGHQKWEFDL